MTPPGIEVLGGRKLGPSDVLPSVVPCGRGRAVAIPGNDATSLNGAAIEPLTDLRTHAKSFQELEALNLFHYSPIDENGGVLGPPFPVVHNNLISLGYIEG